MSKTIPKTVSRAIQETIEQLRNQRFKESSIAVYCRVWDKFSAYAAKRGKHYFSQALAKKYVQAVATRRPAMFPSTLQGIRRAMRVLQEHVVSGSHRRIPLRSKLAPLPLFMEKALSLFIDHLRTEQALSEGTIHIRSADLRRFLNYLRNKDMKRWNEMAPSHITSYLGTLSELAVNTRVSAANSIRQFCRVLFAKGILARPLHDSFPQLRQERGRHLLTLWTEDEIRKTLAAVDRGSPTGKRNYAILLLAARLGLRVGDIKKLRLEDIHWEQSFIEVVQEKTKVPLRIPITDDVGDALADYLRYGRPVSSLREVFLTHYPPYGPLRPKNNLHIVPTQYREKAGLPQRPGCGLHSLRHTLATQLMKAGATPESIGGVLGHKSLDTTLLYLRFDVNSLRQVGLDPDKEVRHA